MRTLISHRWAPAVLVAVVALAACGGDSTDTTATASATTAASTQEIVIEGGTGLFGECLRSAFYDPFTEETGITVLEAAEDSGMARVQLAVETGNYEVDVEQLDSASQLEEFGEELLEPIDYSRVPGDEMIVAPTYGVPVNPNGFVVGYNEEFLPGGALPEGIEDFFDLEKFPGKRALFEFSSAHWIALALLADGVAPDEIVPFDFDRAFTKLDTIKDELVYASSGTDMRALLDAGETPLQITFASRIKESLDAGIPAGAGWDGFSLFANFLAIPKGNPNADVAMDLIAFISRSDISGGMSGCVGVGPANAEAGVDAAAEPYLPTSHLDERYVNLSSSDAVAWMTGNEDEIFNRWQEWRTR